MYLQLPLYIWISSIHLKEAVIQVTTTNREKQLVLLSDVGPLGNSAKSIRFQIKGCRDAMFMASSQTAPLAPYYYVIIGGWSNSKSLLGREIDVYEEKEVYLSTELDCNAFRDFWVRFDEGLVQVGRGSIVGNNVFLSYEEDCEYQIQSLELTTGFTTTVDWKILSLAPTAAPVASPNSRLFRTVFKNVIICPTFEVIYMVKMSTSSSCAAGCSTDPNCRGFLFLPEKQMCEMVSDFALNNTVSSYYKMQTFL